MRNKENKTCLQQDKVIGTLEENWWVLIILLRRSLRFTTSKSQADMKAQTPRRTNACTYKWRFLRRRSGQLGTSICQLFYFIFFLGFHCKWVGQDCLRGAGGRHRCFFVSFFLWCFLKKTNNFSLFTIYFWWGARKYDWISTESRPRPRPRHRRVFIGAVNIFLPLGGSRNKLKGAIYEI